MSENQQDTVEQQEEPEHTDPVGAKGWILYLTEDGPHCPPLGPNVFSDGPIPGWVSIAASFESAPALIMAAWLSRQIVARVEADRPVIEEMLRTAVLAKLGEVEKRLAEHEAQVKAQEEADGRKVSPKRGGKGKPRKRAKKQPEPEPEPVASTPEVPPAVAEAEAEFERAMASSVPGVEPDRAMEESASVLEGISVVENPFEGVTSDDDLPF